MYITYKHRGIKFHVAACDNCKATVTITDRQFNEQAYTQVSPWLRTFNSLECCSKPDFFWAWEDKQL